MRNWLLHSKQLKLSLFIAFFLAFTVVLPIDRALADDPPNEKHELFLSSVVECLGCHKKNEAESFAGQSAKSCSNYCLTCHKGHHKTDIRPKREPRINMPLKENNKITCYTCHDLKWKRFDDTSWKSESLFESIFNREERYPTYYLRIKNNEGALCKNCH